MAKKISHSYDFMVLMATLHNLTETGSGDLKAEIHFGEKRCRDRRSGWKRTRKMEDENRL